MATKPLRSLTFPGLSDTYTVAVTDPTLKLTGEPADAKTVGDWLTTADAKATVAEELATEGLVSYGNEVDWEGNTSQYMTVTRHGDLVTLNGSIAKNAGTNYISFLKLNGTPTWAGTVGDARNFTEPLTTLIEGHKYRFTLKHLSGTISVQENGFGAGVILAANGSATVSTTDIGDAFVSGNVYTREFVYPGGNGVHVGIRDYRTAQNIVMTNVILLATLEDLSIQTEEQKDIEELQETRARIDGAYEGLTAGSAEQLLSTTGAEDRAPYIQRQTGGGVSVGDRAEEKIVGGTIAWNQLVKTEQPTSEASGVTFTNNGDGSWTITGVCTGDVRKLVSVISTTVGHVYYGTPGTAEDGSNSTYHVVLSSSGSDKTNILPANGRIIKPSQTYNQFRIKVYNGFDCDTGVTFKPQFFDLTQMFGSAVADAVYAMEQAATGAGIAWFRAMFPESYYPYNAGELMSVQTSGKTATSADGTVVKTYPLDSSLILRGIPKWDSVKGTMYYDGDEYASDGQVVRKFEYVKASELTWTASSNMDHLYIANVSSVPANKTTRNVLCNKLDQASSPSAASNGGIYVNSSAQIVAGRDDIATLSAWQEWLISADVYFIYELATPISNSATPFQSTQWVESGGTEAFIDAGTETGRVAVPVGHDTFYPTDLRGALETLLSPEVVITDTTATITAERDRRYLCGTMNALTFTPCASGLCEVRFTSGTTATALTLPQTVKMPDWWAGVEANYTYEISIADGVYGAVMAWAT